MNASSNVSLIDLVNCFSRALDLINPTVVNHHKQVAYIASRIAETLQLPAVEKKNIFLASLLHDIGAFSLTDRLNALQFEIDFQQPGIISHGRLGQLLLEKYDPLSQVAPLIGAHHLYWRDRSDHTIPDATLLGSQIIHLADRTAISINKNQAVLGQVPGIMARIEEQSGIMFDPELVKILKTLSNKEYFWLDIVTPESAMRPAVEFESGPFNFDFTGLLHFAKTFCHIIDFRSRFTATHSVGVAASSQAIAALMDFNPRESHHMKIAGYLHDIGKLAISTEILEKPDKLTELEFNIIKSHTYYGFRTLEKVPGLELINSWGSLHHERLDGNGYPFHMNSQSLSLGSRIMAVADMFTALLEDRPYRKGLPEERVLELLKKQAESGTIDREVVAVLQQNINRVNLIRLEAQNEASQEYQEFSRVGS